MGKPTDPKQTSDTIPSRRGTALVALVNNLADWQYVRDKLWYRIPVASAPKRWPPQWLGFYQTKIFGDEAYAVRYYGRVTNIQRVRRETLFPAELPNTKSDREYYQCFLERLETLPQPIMSLRQRRIVFIPTTHRKLMTAAEINDLYDDSPLEDAVWDELKRLHLRAERQYDIQMEAQRYVLDFALFCAKGKIDIETDGDTWHADVERIPQDNERNNALAAKGWQVLRFNGAQVREQMTEYCVPQIVETVNKLGGLLDEQDAPRRYYVTEDGIVQQLALFDGTSAYETESGEADDS